MKRSPLLPLRAGLGGRVLVKVAMVNTLALAACAPDPFGEFNNGSDSLGPVDPVTFPPANLGTDGDRKRPGFGRFSELTAYVGNQPVGYFAYAVPTPPAVPAGYDPLRVLDAGNPYPALPTPLAYVFDAEDQSPFPTDDDYACNAPAGYAYERRRDEIDLSQQAPVFTALPRAAYTEGVAATSNYVPVVSEVRLSSTGQQCQEPKSEKQILPRVAGKPEPSGAYLAWLIIDASAPVFPRDAPTGAYPPGHPMAKDPPQPHPGVGLQRWGWFNRYLLAYLDGGYIPTEDAMIMAGTPPAPRMVKRMRTQRLFIPRQVMGAMAAAPGQRGAGYDVLEYRRGQPGYSPVCQVWVYGDAMMPPPAMAALPRDAATILSTAGLNPAPAAPATYVYCLQVNQ